MCSSFIYQNADNQRYNREHGGGKLVKIQSLSNNYQNRNHSLRLCYDHRRAVKYVRN
jgi:hypothetical protein